MLNRYLIVLHCVFACISATNSEEILEAQRPAAKPDDSADIANNADAEEETLVVDTVGHDQSNVDDDVNNIGGGVSDAEMTKLNGECGEDSDAELARQSVPNDHVDSLAEPASGAVPDDSNGGHVDTHVEPTSADGNDAAPVSDDGREDDACHGGSPVEPLSANEDNGGDAADNSATLVLRLYLSPFVFSLCGS